MHRKMPLPRGWKRRDRSSSLSDVILNLPDSMTNMPFLGRPESVNQYTPGRTQDATGRRRRTAPTAHKKRAAALRLPPERSS